MKKLILAGLLLAVVGGCATQPIGVGPARRSRSGEATNLYVLGIPIKWGHGIADACKAANIDYVATVDHDFRWFLFFWYSTTTVWGESREEFWANYREAASRATACPGCGIELETGAKFCKGCGRARSDAIQPVNSGGR